jgi:hypothetical protein
VSLNNCLNCGRVVHSSDLQHLVAFAAGSATEDSRVTAASERLIVVRCCLLWANPVLLWMHLPGAPSFYFIHGALVSACSVSVARTQALLLQTMYFT